MFQIIRVKKKILNKGRVQKKSWNFPTLSENPPPFPPLKVGKYPIFFFYMTRRANFLLLNFSHIRVMKHTISKNQNFQKKILYCVGAGTPWSLATQPTLGGGRAVSLK